MIDHVGFPVSNYVKSKAFYDKALAPLGYGVIMEAGTGFPGYDSVMQKDTATVAEVLKQAE